MDRTGLFVNCLNLVFLIANMYRMADFDELRTFVTAVRLGSFAAAARQLNLSPAMVGRRIQTLEERYRLKLIERSTRSQHITEEGRDFLARAETVLEAAEALGESTGGTELTGRIRITAPTIVGVTRLPAILAAFDARHPGVILEVNLNNRRVDLITEGFDLAIRIGTLPDSGLIARRLGDYGFACCAAPDFIRRYGKLSHPSQLSQARCLLNLNLVPRNRWPFVGPDGQEVIITVGGGIEIDLDEAQRRLAIDGAGIAYLPLDLVEADLAQGRLVPMFSDWTMPSMPIHAVQPSRRFVPRRVREFVEVVAASFSGSSQLGSAPEM
ncbi:LysR family transcriptional regulator [Neoaquamicrobium sediminum]|uniref:LysR family transcriptional regulator n=1 Tax=Neoaquamicrobium sediminum TaxID=1849104 RepID=A0ABV3WRT7_9HYPH